MIISVILAHPDPKSFNHAIASTAVEAIKANGHKVFFTIYIRKNSTHCFKPKK